MGENEEVFLRESRRDWERWEGGVSCAGRGVRAMGGGGRETRRG